MNHSEIKLLTRRRRRRENKILEEEIEAMVRKLGYC